jgi:hypothetical protein
VEKIPFAKESRSDDMAHSSVVEIAFDVNEIGIKKIKARYYYVIRFSFFFTSILK